MSSSEKGNFAKSSEALPGAAVFARDLIGSTDLEGRDLFPQFLEMSQKLFGATAENNYIKFSNAKINIISRRNGWAMLALRVDDSRTEFKYLGNAVVQDAEGDNGPALNIIFPRSENGVKVVTLTRDGASQRSIVNASSPEDEEILVIADKLPLQRRLEDPPVENRGDKSPDLPLVVEANGREIHVIDERVKDIRAANSARGASGVLEVRSFKDMVIDEAEHRRGIPEVRRFDDEELTLEKVEEHQEKRYKETSLEPVYEKVHERAEKERKHEEKARS